MSNPTGTLVLLDGPATLELAPDPVAAVLAACERARGLLALVLEHGDIDHLVELKAQAQAITVYTRQKELGREAELAAAEIVRRAERGVALAIRRGQDKGEIETPEEARLRASQMGSAARLGGQNPSSNRGRDESSVSRKPRPRDYASKPELSSTHGDIYDLAESDDTSFETALADAKQEGNLSRRNVVRKIRGEQPKPDRPEHLRRMRRPDPNRIVDQTIAMSGIDEDLADQIDYAALDRDRLEMWISSLSTVIRSLQDMHRKLKKELNRGQDY